MVIKKETKDFYRWKKKLLITDKILSIFFILFLGAFRPDHVVITAYILLVPYIIITLRKKLFCHFLIASLVSFVWLMIAKDQYGYNISFYIFKGVNLYPLFAWAVGLFLTYLLYSHYENTLKKQGYLKTLSLFILFYWPLLIFTETIAYHVFNIHNVATAAYAGLPLCDCIHAPRWMQASYFAIGPIFFSICYALKLENPHLP